MKRNHLKLFIAIISSLYFCVSSFAQQFELLSQLVNGSSRVCTLENDLLYFDSGNKVTISNVSNSAVPDVLGTFLLNTTVLDLDVVGEHLAVLDAHGYFNLFNVEDPEEVTFLDSINLGAVFFDPIWETYSAQLIARNDTVFILREDQGLTVIDISQPNSCQILGTYASPDFYSYHSMAISQNLMLLGGVGENWDSFLVQTIDITFPAAPVFLGSVNINEIPEGLTISGNTAFVAAGGQGLVSLDITHHMSPTVLDTSYWDGWYTEVVVDSDYAYVASDAEGLTIIDISDPSAMPDMPVGSYEPPEEYSYGSDIVLADGIAFLCIGLSGLHILDVSPPQETSYLASGSPNSGGGAFGVAYKDDYVYIADFGNDLTIVNVADPTVPYIVRNVGFDGIGLKVEIFGDYAYVSGTYGLHIVDISDPENAFLADEFIRGSYGATVWTHGVDVKGDICYLAYKQRGLFILDVSDPEQIVELANYDPDAEAINDVQVVDSLAYILFRSNDGQYPDPDLQYMEVLNVADPTNPQFVGSWTGSVEWAWGNSLIVRDSTAYLLDNEGMFILDISDPTAITQLGIWGPGGWNFRISENGQFAFVAKEGGGMKVVDIADPATPTRVGNYRTIDWCADIEIRDSLVYIADYDGGLLIVRHDFSTVAIDRDPHATTPESFNLEQNFPNPFNPATTIRFQIPYPSEIELSIHDILGREIRGLSTPAKAAGSYSITWNGKDTRGVSVGSGMYFYTLSAGEYTETRKMLLLK
ncbi:MAG: T9SS type A sorting domain-containing protein [FCB group bacterium]|nr:T9SS type A sorting domain-containing protein [FCB group bacterium]MBL7120358.1 T9SS type A sorting domain-containing protein [Candidatus Neomarinimicrobiota bacterium]